MYDVTDTTFDEFSQENVYLKNVKFIIWVICCLNIISFGSVECIIENPLKWVTFFLFFANTVIFLHISHHFVIYVLYFYFYQTFKKWGSVLILLLINCDTGRPMKIILVSLDFKKLASSKLFLRNSLCIIILIIQWWIIPPFSENIKGHTGTSTFVVACLNNSYFRSI